MDLSLVIAVAALVLSVLSPVLSSVISGTFRIKEKKIELNAEKAKWDQTFYAQHRAEVIERYLNVVGKYSKLPATSTREEFGSCMGEIYLYVNRSLWPILDSIADTKRISKH